MVKREPISNEEFNQWRNDPVSRKIIDRMDNLVEYIKQQWYEGCFEDSGGEDGTKSAEASALKDAYHRGYANGIHEFLRVETVEVMKRPDSDFRG
jgi:hypothetical protein